MDDLREMVAALQQTYLHTVRHLMPGPVTFTYVVPLLLLPAALMVPPQVLSQAQLASLVMPITISCLIHSWLAMGAIDVMSVNAFFWTLKLIVLFDVRRDFKRVPLERQLQKTGSKPPTGSHDQDLKDISYPSDLKARYFWVMNLLISTRLHRWKVGSASHDRAMDQLGPPPKRLRFCLVRLRDYAFNMLLMSFLIRMIREDPFLRQGWLAWATTDQPPPSVVISFLWSLPHALIRPMVCGLWIFCGVNMIYNLPAPIAVTCNYLFGVPSDADSPHTHPLHFGPFVKGVLDGGLRGVWGTWWHQQMRALASAPGRACAKWLNLTPGGAARFSLLLYSSFIVSGLVHAGLIPAEPLYSTVSPNLLRLQVFAFFVVQAVGITLEMLVVERLLKAFPSPVARLLRFAWAVFFLCLVFPLLYPSFVELRWFCTFPPPPPVVPQSLQGTFAGDWVP